MTSSGTASYKAAVLAENGRTPELAERRQRELDAQVEDLARRLAEVINKAGPGHRQDLREYAIDLLREGTEAVATTGPRPSSAPRPGTNPLGMAILLGVIGLPMFVLFAPMGIALLGTALVLGTWGVLSVLLRRSSQGDSR